MSEEWRVLLYYPLGCLASLFFTMRILIQWIKSEKAGYSYINASFWRLSLTGNIFLFLHFTVQGQYPFALIQMSNALISWRNLDLMNKKQPLTFCQTMIVFASVFVLTCGLLLLIGMLTHTEWIRIPKSPISSIVHDPGFWWHAIGFLGQILFASRFWLQWWISEKNKRSELGTIFWWVSLIGSFLSAAYFLKIEDVVGFLGQIFGIVPYFRNLVLISRANKNPLKSVK